MSRKLLLQIIIFSFLLSFTLLCLWVFFSWRNSIPEINLVKGTSDDIALTSKSQAHTDRQLEIYPEIKLPQGLQIYAKQYVLYHAESGKVVLRSKEMNPVPIASTTKLMTGYIVIKYADLNEIVTISDESSSQIGSVIGLRPGERISVRALLYGIMLSSGNDSAHALAEYVGGKLFNNQAATSAEKVKRFVEEMNIQASYLFLNQTEYKDPAGLDTGLSTALDLAKLASYINKNPVLTQIMNTATITVFDEEKKYRYDLRNSNRLVTDYQYAGGLGGKTGYTPEAGHCLVSSAKRDGHTLIGVVLGTLENTNDASAIETKRLLDYGFQFTSWY